METGGRRRKVVVLKKSQNCVVIEVRQVSMLSRRRCNNRFLLFFQKVIGRISPIHQKTIKIEHGLCANFVYVMKHRKIT